MPTNAQYPTRRIAFLVEYDGTDFFGWQAQKGELPTIQGTIRKVLDEFFQMPTPIDGSSRTDAGVHATSQVAAFTISHPIQLPGLEKMLNSRLPNTIAVRDLREVNIGFFPRRAVQRKTYAYRLYSNRWQRPLLDRFSTRTSHHLDLSSMRAASEYVVGTHDFTSFAASDHQSKQTVRTIEHIHINPLDTSEICFEFVGTGFLKQMVRNLVGSLIEVGRHNRSVAWMSDTLHLRDRTAAGPTAPARGLVLRHSDVDWSYGRELEAKLDTQ